MRFVVLLIRSALLPAPILLERAFLGADSRKGYSPVWRICNQSMTMEHQQSNEFEEKIVQAVQ